ncbi:uncharacterized protein LOC122266027 [Penaeus japonicus]|uniref:uncharacterized protein LOC122266027 n=1 Tax=Penaeus japonicus TaxID=27405 RepID=UPI001C70B180|nr:uncharacterized protein LOC122266027 [Penaeus japonicus]
MKKYSNKVECRRLRPKLFKDQCTSAPRETKQKSPEGCGEGTVKPGPSGHIRQPQDAVQCYDPPIRVKISDSPLTDAFLSAGRETDITLNELKSRYQYFDNLANTSHPP